ncbi:glycine betaine ABC transporter substrate-binding protein [Solicola gregarius]|uniref:Glycine betaine ABC transporter substrate-binding protein n=1 Tax=Solicola gregarius TaxID=2908642 RepID=A0AA46TLP7_9ACTN|nr:glycine betaine ABC transporter substrate-binding protein [Solicola gregarius]UYM07581.1 glycine betaine ABC transporter substrate-binding protein [Solicola gregarius]
MKLSINPSSTPLRALAVTAAIGLALSGCSLDDEPKAKSGDLAEEASLDGASLTVGGKEFTEQLILCEITAQALESAGADVERKCGLAGSNTTHTALTSGEIDMYWEYTGTTWISYLKHTDPIPDAQKQFDAVAKEDLAKNDIEWLDPAQYNSTYAIAVASDTADELGVKTLSDYAKVANSNPEDASMCVNSEFEARNDGLPGLEKKYGFDLPSDAVKTIAMGTIPKAVSEGDPCNFGDMTSVDGRIPALDLTVLEDDKHFFPIYNPAPNVNKDVLADNPDIAKVLSPIAEALDEEAIQKLNAKVDIDGLQPEDAAQEWLQEHDFIG